jgi:hypothetical protein
LPARKEATMEIVCITGAVPGRITATLTHAGTVRQVPMELAAHPAGGWHARRSGGAYGLRSHTVNTAILLEAAEAWDSLNLAMAAE